MNYNSLRLSIRVAQNICYKSTFRQVIISHLSYNQFCSTHVLQNHYSTRADSFTMKDSSFFDDIKQKIKLQFQKNKLHGSGYYLYECVADQLDYSAFFKEFEMPDTFNTWFLITELHVWMLMARAMAQPKYGRFVRNVIVEAMWNDATLRAKKLGPEHLSVIRTQIVELSEEFQAALVNYDEGILSDDTVLAGAMWRRILNRNCSARQLEGMVKYVRQTMFLLDKLGPEELFTKKRIKWLPISEVFKTLPP